MSRLIDLELKSETVWLSCPWDAQIVATIKTIPGREFDKRTRRWSVPMAQIATVIQLLEPLHFRFTPRMRSWWADHRDSLPDPDATAQFVEVDPDDGYTVSRLNDEARRVLTEHFGEVWLVAELDSYDRNKSDGHAYFELVERAATGPVISTIRAVLFASTRERIDSELPDDLALGDGATLRLRGKVELYAPKGSYQFVVGAVDVEWAVGARRKKRDEVLERLEQEQLASRNRQLAMPLLPTRIGLITARGSDAYNDFVHELERSGRGFDVSVHPARMQGRDAEATIVEALQWFAQRAEAFDAVVITRGGGSRGDLSTFDSYRIGRAVCELPIKVIAGIGHHRDRSVLDFVAMSEKTPTAAARALIGHVERVAERLDHAARHVALVSIEAMRGRRRRIDRVAAAVERNATARLAIARRAVDRAASGCERSAVARLSGVRRAVDRAAAACERSTTARLAELQRRVDRARVRIAERGFAPLIPATQRVDRAADDLERVAGVQFANRRLNLEHIEAKLRLADPRRVVERGFALLRDTDGAVVTEGARLLQLDAADVEMRDGVVRVVPMEVTDE